MTTLFRQGGWVLVAIVALSTIGWAQSIRVWLRLAGKGAEADSFRGSLTLVASVGVACPLLGLLGTVLGMLETFELMSAYGAVGLEGLAGGISRALVTTQAGLVMALPIVVMHRWLSGRISRLEYS